METRIIELFIVAGSLLMLDLYDGNHPAPTLGGVPLAAAMILVLGALGMIVSLIPGGLGLGIAMLFTAALILLLVEGQLHFAGFNPTLYGRDRRFLAGIAHALRYFRSGGQRHTPVRH